MAVWDRTVGHKWKNAQSLIELEENAVYIRELVEERAT